MATAFGKVILLGEHAVVYGHPALAGAIDAGLGCAWRARPAPAPRPTDERERLRLLVPAWALDVTIEAGGSEDDPQLDEPEQALHTIVRALGAHLDVDLLEALGTGELVVETALPAAAGLGSSAALAVALVRTLGEALGHALSDREVMSLADSAERCFHDNPSGVDVALATCGGLGVYRRGVGLAPLDAPPIALAVGLSGRPRSTAAMVARVNAAWEADRTRVDDRLAELGQIASAGAEALARGEIATLGRLMDRAHAILAGLGLSCRELDELCDLARRAGAAGAKLTGAGGGGAAIAVGPDRAALETLVRTWREAGYHGFVCRAGAHAAG